MPSILAKSPAHPQRSLDSALSLQSALADLLSNPLRFEKSHLQQSVPAYEPINATDGDTTASSSFEASAGPSKPRLPSRIEYDPPATPSTAPAPSASASSPSASASASAASPSTSKHLFPGKVPLTWPSGTRSSASGLYNKGNTCYMNSTMQALVHTAPLTHLLFTHERDSLKGRLGGTLKSGFDPVAALQSFTRRAIGRDGRDLNRVAPQEFIKNLKSIARTFSHGRQEDAHEWLRMLLDATQQSCLANASSKAKQSALRETTFVHKIFGGKLRSRITCMRCKHNSDTFDPILDLSLDIRRCDTLGDAMNLFTEIEELRGSEKYRCEKCKVLVNARKNFTMEECPNVLTVHLKRFTFTGSKISRPISFPEQFKVKGNWTSSGKDGPTYHLYAVVHHYGGGPHSGHYIAQVKSPAGKWMEMNDDMVSPIGKPGQGSKSAYLLFYVRDAKESLDQVVNAASTLRSSADALHQSRPILAEPTKSSPSHANRPSKRQLLSDEDAGSLLDDKKESFVAKKHRTTHNVASVSPSMRPLSETSPSSTVSGSPAGPAVASRFSAHNGPKRKPSLNGYGSDFLARLHRQERKHSASPQNGSPESLSAKASPATSNYVSVKNRMKPRKQP